MKKIKYLLLVVVTLLVVTGCKSKEEKIISDVVKNTSISEKKVESYRAKVSIKGNNINEEYIVLNNNNKEYKITIFNDKNESKTYEIKDEKSKNKNEVKEQDDIDLDTLKEKYTNTDLFLTGLNIKESAITESKEKIADTDYTKYTFKVTSDTMNKILAPFNIETKIDGEGYALLDKENHVYLINYNVDNIDTTVSYTRIKEIK